MLKQYIIAAYPSDVALSNLEAAGASLYKKSKIGNWTDVTTLIQAANNFISNNTADLLANNNMPDTFPNTFQNMSADCIKASVTYFNADNAKKMAVNAKTQANNAIYESVMAMLKDAQQIYKDNDAVRSLFVFSQQAYVHQNANTARLSGYILNDIKLPIAGATIATKQLAYSATTNDKGRFNFNRITAGDYNVTISCPGYVPVDTTITLVAGTKSRLNLTLASALKKVA